MPGPKTSPSTTSTSATRCFSSTSPAPASSRRLPSAPGLGPRQPETLPLWRPPLEWLLWPSWAQELELPRQGLSGKDPLPWWAAGLYADGLRRRLLGLRRNPREQWLRPLLPGLIRQLRRVPGAAATGRPTVLVAVPSWKRRANPLPPLLATLLSQELGWPQRPLLERSRPVLGQHRLGRDLRWQNQQDAFRCLKRPPGGVGRVVLLDDILTTGATACGAAAALEERGWRVLGMACLGRTPQTIGAATAATQR